MAGERVVTFADLQRFDNSLSRVETKVDSAVLGQTMLTVEMTKSHAALETKIITEIGKLEVKFGNMNVKTKIVWAIVAVGGGTLLLGILRAVIVQAIEEVMKAHIG